MGKNLELESKLSSPFNCSTIVLVILETDNSSDGLSCECLNDTYFCLIFLHGYGGVLERRSATLKNKNREMTFCFIELIRNDKSNFAFPDVSR